DYHCNSYAGSNTSIF
nr:immunoglobulin light chain junction region [Macaca mulatta]MOW28084.1 immunoglobulin light chain junction region [Macaca mulatta]